MVAGADGGPSGLTPRAEDLLLLLCRNPDALVTREEILEHVWSGSVVEDAAITNCVWQIRKAFGEQHKHLLQTRTKRGYLLSVPDEAWLHDGETAPAVAPSAPAPAVEPAAPAVAPAAPVAVPQTVRAPRWFWLFAALLLVVNVSVYVAFWPSGGRDTVSLSPDYEIRLSIIAPDSMDTLRVEVLRQVAMQAYLRHARVSLINQSLRRETFPGPTLHLEVDEVREDRLAATLRLSDEHGVRSQVVRGPASELPAAVAEFMRRHLPAAGKREAPGVDAYIAGVVAEQRFDSATALREYRSALAQYPAMPEAKIAIIRIDFAQGRWNEATLRAQQLAGDKTLPQHQRCELSLLLLDVAPARKRQRALQDKQAACGQ